MVNTYIYITDQNFVSKYCFNIGKKYKTSNFEYIPILNNLNINVAELANSKFLIYLKSNKDTKSIKTGFCGYFESEGILLNEKMSKNFDKIPQNVKVDKILYNNMISKYNLFENSNLIFVKYNSLISFGNIFSTKTIYELAEKKGYMFEINKITKKHNICNIIENKICNIIDLIVEFQLEQEKENEEKEEKNDCELQEGDNEEDNTEMIMMDIPILWNPCDEIIEKIENKSIKRKDIKKHYAKCNLCEIVDNNRISPDFKKQITFNITENKEIVERIIQNYQFTEKYIEKKDIFNECNMIENKINILYYNNDKELYSQSIFLINKL